MKPIASAWRRWELMLIVLAAIAACAGTAAGAGAPQTYTWNAPGDGNWNTAANWIITAGSGTGTTGVPGTSLPNFAADIVTSNGVSHTVTYDFTGSATVPLLAINGSGGAAANNTLLISTTSLLAGEEDVGSTGGVTTGSGTITQTGATNSFNIALDIGLTSTGIYNLSGTGLVTANNRENVLAKGTFNQNGGTNNITGSNLGTLAVAGVYNLNTGSLTSAGGESVTGSGNFNQNGGSNQISAGTLTIDSGATYTLIVPGGTGTSTAALSVAANEIIGNTGTGNFIQAGASSNTITASAGLILGNAANKTGNYTLDENATLTVGGAESIGLAGIGNFTQNGGANNTASLTIAAQAGSTGSYALSAGTLSVTNAVTVNTGGTFTLGSGTTLSYATFSQFGAFSGTLSNATAYTWHEGAFTGQLTNHGTANVDGTLGLPFSPTTGIDNFATLNLTNSGVIGGGGFVTNESTGTIQGFGVIGNTGALNNIGVINSNIAAGNLAIGGQSSAANSGTIKATNGGSITLNNPLINNVGGTISASNGTVSHTSLVNIVSSHISGGTINGDGASIGAVVIKELGPTSPELDGSPTGGLTLSGDIVPDSAIVIAGNIINNAALLDTHDANANITPPAWNLIVGDATTTSATLSGSGSINMEQDEGSITGAVAANTLINNIQISADGPDESISGLNLTNNGNIVAGGGLQMLSVGTMLNSASGTISAASGGVIQIEGGASSTLNNSGLIQASSVGTLTISGTTITNSGTINATGGGTVNLQIRNLSINNVGGTISATNGNASHTSIVNLDGKISGGNLNGDGNNFGALVIKELSTSAPELDGSPAGGLTLTGDIVPDSSSIVIAGSIINNAPLTDAHDANSNVTPSPWNLIVGDASTTSATLSGSGSINMSQGSGTISGAVATNTLTNGSQISANAGFERITNLTLINNGAIISAGNLYFTNDPSITNGATGSIRAFGGTVEIDGPATLSNSGLIQSISQGSDLWINGPAVINSGTIEDTGGATLELDAPTVVNTGGTISVDGGSTDNPSIAHISSHISGGAISVSPDAFDVAVIDNKAVASPELDGSPAGGLALSGDIILNAPAVVIAGHIALNGGGISNPMILTDAADPLDAGLGITPAAMNLKVGDASTPSATISDNLFGHINMTRQNASISGAVAGSQLTNNTTIYALNSAQSISNLSLINNGNIVLQGNGLGIIAHLSMTGLPTINNTDTGMLSATFGTLQITGPTILTNNGLINATNLGTMTIENCTITNTGTLEATATDGTLNLNNCVINNSNGQISALGGSINFTAFVVIDSSKISGGGLGSAYGGVISIAGTNPELDGGATHGPITLGGIILPNAMRIAGMIVNNASVNDVTYTTDSPMTITVGDDAGATSAILSGNGNVMMTLPASTITGYAGTNTLTNDTNHTIEGEGTITNLTLLNNGTIKSNDSGGTLTISPGSGGFSNSNVLETANTATLVLDSTHGPISFTSTSVVTADPGATINFIGGGTLTNSGGISVGSGSIFHVTGNLTNTASGSINVDHAHFTVTGTFTNHGSFTSDPSTVEFGNVDNESGGTITTSPGDNYTIDGSLTNNGGTISVAGGTSLTTTGPLLINGGTIGGDGTTVAAGGMTISNSVLKTGTGLLTVVGNLTVNPDAKFDLNRGNMIVDYTGASPASTIRNLLATGFHNGSWDGIGIASLAAHNDVAKLTALAYAEASDLGITTYGGQPVDSTTLIVMYTYGGDANLDGKIDADDYFQIDSNYNKPGLPPSYFRGDFNYDGLINGDDYFIIDSDYVAQGASLAAGAAVNLESSSFVGLTAVPEPAELGACVLTLMLLARRRTSEQQQGIPSR